jgi:hypothetical protein
LGEYLADYTVPQHPEDGIFFGWFFLGLSVVALGAVVVTKLLGLW